MLCLKKKFVLPVIIGHRLILLSSRPSPFGEHHSTNILYVEEVSLETSQDEILHTLSEWKEMGIENQLEDSVFIVKSMISWMKETA